MCGHLGVQQAWQLKTFEKVVPMKLSMIGVTADVCCEMESSEPSVAGENAGWYATRPFGSVRRRVARGVGVESVVAHGLWREERSNEGQSSINMENRALQLSATGRLEGNAAQGRRARGSGTVTYPGAGRSECV